MASSTALRYLLWPFAMLYGGVALTRAWLYARGIFGQRRLKGFVISVGNITVGGTGKTPMVIWLAERFIAQGKRVAILSRGYRGEEGTSDEIELMKKRLGERVSFGVGKHRFSAGRLLETRGIDVFLLDDGFQHLQLARDFDIVVIDRLQAVRSESLLPAGRLREPMAALNRSDAVIYTRMNGAKDTVRLIQQLKRFPIFPAITKLQGFRRWGANEIFVPAREMGTGSFYAFCGIGNPEAFFLDLERWGLCLSGRRSFRDHHKYTAAELAQLVEAAEKSGAIALVTTEKDLQNLGNLQTTRLPLFICVIAMEIPDEKQLLALIDAKFRERAGVAA
jgi:tetraacyldisaccharide 4'-kinase